MLGRTLEYVRGILNSLPRQDRQNRVIAVSDEPTTEARNLTEFSHELYVDSTALTDALADCSPERSLEVGCGFGRLTPWIISAGGDHHAIDSEPPHFASARTEYPDVTFREARAEDLPYPDNFFDLVVTWGVLNHVPSNAIRDAAMEVKRVTSADGTIVVSEATAGREDPRWTYRSVDEWAQLFAPRDLVCQTATERDAEQFRDDLREHMVMKFR